MWSDGEVTLGDEFPEEDLGFFFCHNCDYELRDEHGALSGMISLSGSSRTVRGGMRISLLLKVNPRAISSAARPTPASVNLCGGRPLAEIKYNWQPRKGRKAMQNGEVRGDLAEKTRRLWIGFLCPKCNGNSMKWRSGGGHPKEAIIEDVMLIERNSHPVIHGDYRDRLFGRDARSSVQR